MKYFLARFKLKDEDRYTYRLVEALNLSLAHSKCKQFLEM